MSECDACLRDPDVRKFVDDRNHLYDRLAAMTVEKDGLVKLLQDINSRVIPGDTDSIDSLRAMYWERDRYREALEKSGCHCRQMMECDCGMKNRVLSDAALAGKEEG